MRSIRSPILALVVCLMAPLMMLNASCAGQGAGKVLAGEVRSSLDESIRPHAELGLRYRIEHGQMQESEAEVFRREWDTAGASLAKLAGQSPPAPRAPGTPASLPPGTAAPAPPPVR